MTRERHGAIGVREVKQQSSVEGREGGPLMLPIAVIAVRALLEDMRCVLVNRLMAP